MTLTFWGIEVSMQVCWEPGLLLESWDANVVVINVPSVQESPHPFLGLVV